MTKSNVEEIIGILWFILGVICWEFGLNFIVWGACVIQGLVAIIAAINYAKKEIKTNG